MLTVDLSGRSKPRLWVGIAATCASLPALGATPASGPGDRAAVIEEVIVTAQKRSESLQDVPSSISVLGGAQLESLQAAQLTDYAAYVPGFQVDSNGTPGAGQITLRGVAAGSFTSPTVGTYIDDAPLGASSKNTEGSSFALDLMPYDIERIEVLRGPQGTLYGASTMGGLLKYVMRAPNLEEFEARVGLDASSVSEADDNGWGVRGGINLPLAPGKLALRATYFNQTRPGYIDNGRTGLEDENELRQEGGRVSLLWQATDAFSVKLSGMLQQTEADGASTTTLFASNQQPVNGELTLRHIAEQPYEQELEFFSAALNWSLSWADFTSATSYSHMEVRSNPEITHEVGFLVQQATGGFVPVSQIQMPLTSSRDLDKVTQEFRLASPSGGKVEWLVGAFYTKEDYHLFQTLHTLFLDGSPVDLRPFGGPNLEPFGFFDDPSTYEESALFGDVTFKFTPTFDLTAGVRLAHNRDRFHEHFEAVIGARDAIVTSEEDIFTYMVSPRWHLSEDTMIYGRVASSYRPGGPNVRLTEDIPLSVDADTLVNYELGIKSNLLDRRLLLDAAVFYIDWKDIQVNAETADELGYITNASRASNVGLEVTVEYRPVPGLRLGLNGSYLNAELTEDADPSLNLPWFDGARLPLSAEWSGAVTANYELPLTGALNGEIGGGYRYVGNRLTDVESDPDVRRLPSYDVLDLSVGVSSDNWTLRLYGKNVTDERALLTVSDTGTDPVLLVPVLITSVLQPRTIGLSLDVRF